jgi:Xaa-Pro dipeptidase
VSNIKKDSSKEHQLLQEGMSWKDSMDEEDFNPHIPREEFDLRIANAKRSLEKHGVDCMVLFSYDNKYYYGGYRESNIRYSHRWRHCVIVSQEHDPVFVGESVLSNSVQRTTWIKDLRAWSDIKFWRLPTRFIDLFVDTMNKLNLDNKVIGLEYGPEYVLEVSIDEIRQIEKSLPNARFVSADEVVWEQRMIKTDWEIELMRVACEKAGRVLENGWKTIKPGNTERDVHRAFWEQYVREDMYDAIDITNVTLFLCGTDAPGKWRLVSTPFYDRVIREGDQGFSDSGPTYRGYWTDFQRSFYVGKKLPPKLADLSKWGRDAYLNTVNNILPGMRGCDVFEMAKKETYRQDWNQAVPIDFVGHGIGLLNHEQPWLSPDDLTVLQPGMIICVEVGCFGDDLIYFGNMPEDIYLVTDSGLEKLGIDFPVDVCLCG